MSPLDEALEALPKVELHCHVEGTMRAATVAELAAANGIALPVEDPSERSSGRRSAAEDHDDDPEASQGQHGAEAPAEAALRRRSTRMTSTPTARDVEELYAYDSLTGFLDVFWLVQSVLGSRGDWARLGYESAIDGAAHGLAYRESFFTPARHLAAGQALADVVAGLDEGLAAAEAETGVRVALILDFDRDFGAAAAEEQVDALIALRRAGARGVDRVIGVGYDSTEIGQEPGWYATAFQRAGAAGLRRTAHQGENSGPDAIVACVDLLGAERIDHGLSILGDHDVVQRFVDEQIALTVCPSSNIRIANAFPTLAEHVYPEMRERGLLATLNTDDPSLTDLDIGLEYRNVAAAFGWGWDRMVDIALDGVEACWLDPDAKTALRTRTEAAREDLRPG